jgi:pimeloyl-ACP methyl ester carboxylesterase
LSIATKRLLIFAQNNKRDGTDMAKVKANGLEIEYESFGRDSDSAILLIMGFGAQLTMWPTEFCEGLAAKGYRVIRFDNRDVGLSTHLHRLGMPDTAAAMGALMSGGTTASAYTLDDMAKDAVCLLDALGIKRAHIVGASMGGMIAQLVAINHPGHTISLTSIMSTTARPGLPPGKPEAMAALTTPPASDSREDRIAAGLRVAHVLGSPGFPDSEADIVANTEAAIDRAPFDPAGVARQLTAIIAAYPRHEKLKSVRAPTLVLHGADDPILVLDCGKDTAACVPGAKLVVVPGMAHDFSKGLVPVYIQHLSEFIGSVEKAKAA